MDLLPLVIKYWKYLAGILIIGGLVFWLSSVFTENHNLKDENDTLTAKEAVMQAQLNLSQDKIIQMANERAQAAQNYQKAETLQKQVRNAKPEDDGDVAPVLRNVISELRGPAGHNHD